MTRFIADDVETTDAVEATSLHGVAVEVDRLQQLCRKLVDVMRQQNDRIETLEAMMERAEFPTERERALARYAVSSTNNRKVKAPAVSIALAGWLYHVKGVPSMYIYGSGLLTQSKVSGVIQWDKQHLSDYCLINGVEHTYNFGLSVDEIRALVTDVSQLMPYLTDKTESLDTLDTE